MTVSSNPIKRDSALPIWQQIRDILRRQISEGAFTESGKLPSAVELAQQFSVNRHTVRQALLFLEESGEIETRQGAGSFVMGRTVHYPITHKTRFSEIILNQGMEPSGEIIRISEKPATKAIASALKLKQKARVLLVERICRADGRIVGFARHYFSATRPRGLRPYFEKNFSISDALKEVGVETYSRQSTIISTRLPSGKEARHLEQSNSRPVLVSEAINIDGDGRPIEFGSTLFVADRVRLKL